MNTRLLGNTLEPLMQGVSVDSVVIGGALLIGLIFFLVHHKFDLRPVFFYAFGAVSLVVTTVLLLSTSLLQIQSGTAGAAHTQAEIEFWVCGTEISPLTHNLSNDRRFSQGAKRVYLSGFTPADDEAGSLRGYVAALGGELQDESLRLPLAAQDDEWTMPEQLRDGDPQGDLDTRFMQRYMIRQNTGSPDESFIDITSGQRCPRSTETELQVFVYSADPDSNSYQQQKLDNPSQYRFTAGQPVPPGDCVIVEFDESKDRTDKLCPGYGMRDSQRCLTFGVQQLDDGYCSYEQVDPEEISD